MNLGFRLKRENPETRANCVSKFLFTWTIKSFRKVNKTGIEIEDLYKLSENNKSVHLTDKLQVCWGNELRATKKKGGKPSLAKAMYKAFGKEYMLWGFVVFIQMMSRTLIPIVLAYFISFFSTENRDISEKEMYIFGTLIVAITLITTSSLHHAHHRNAIQGMHWRVALSSLVYRKITRLSQTALSKTATGQIVNLISNDVSRIDMIALYLNHLWVLPIFVIVLTYILWYQLGISCLVGVGLMVVLSLPLQSYLGKLIKEFRLKIAKRTDSRVRFVSEIVSGIKVIKMYAWEKPFEKLVKKFRDSELTRIKITSYYQGVFSSYIIFLSGITLYFTLNCYVLLGNQLTATKVFPSTQGFTFLQVSFGIMLPRVITLLAEVVTSMQRLTDFLQMEEKVVTEIGLLHEPSVKMVGVSAFWTPDAETLKDITLHIQPGILCAIVGPVGAGKSSLLQVLLGELAVSSGKVSVGGDISIASQQPWLFSASVKNNILFGQPYDKEWYEEVVRVCALERDFFELPYGDNTLVGDKGDLLSGGQKARVNLARAVYRKADVYIMDDPLSAVDTHVGKYLFDECIRKHLWNKTRILVTHQLQYVRNADLIVVMNKGRIEATGTFDELANKFDLKRFLALSEDVNEFESENAKDEFRKGMRKTSDLSIGENSTLKATVRHTHKSVTQSKEESRSHKDVSPMLEYVKATNNKHLVTSLILLLVLAQVFVTATDYWVAYWTRQEEMRVLTSVDSNLSSSFPHSPLDDNSHFLDTKVSLIIYAGVTLTSVILTFGRSFMFFKAAMLSSKKLHEKMVHCLLKAPMRFFHSNPCGRILNRFSKDMGAIDEVLPKMLLDAIQVTLGLFGTLVNVGISNPYTIAAALVFGILFWKIFKLYVSTTKKIKHVESVTKSAVFSHVSATIGGISTIRALRTERLLTAEFDQHQDVHTAASYMSAICMVSFGLWLDLLCTAFTACITYSFIIVHYYIPVNDTMVGLALTQILGLTSKLQFGMRQLAEVANQLTSVERVLQYTKIETEGPLETLKEHIPKSIWPREGRIIFKNVSLQYIKGDPPVLKNLCFTIREGEKIGIVGRTGAGKSSLISALFRLADLDGYIYIDGVDIKTLGLNDLRRQISIIPQDPVLFSAELRYNLDPLNEYGDELLWKALEEVDLKSSVKSLDFMVSEGGSNFSLGQRQLICLARALLRKNKILVLDEATANVDLKTDIFIQSKISEKFKDCTVLTIAHRLNTIMDFDRILVMSAGKNVEFDHPYLLLQDENGYFSKMVQETGLAMSQRLRNIALESFHKGSTNM